MLSDSDKATQSKATTPMSKRKGNFAVTPFAMIRSGESNVPPLLRNLVILPPSVIDFTPYENVSSPAYGEETTKLISSAQGPRPIHPFIGLFACRL